MSVDTVLISVIVPFYNVEHYVRTCVDSLLMQTFESYEVICIDDGSTDGTGALLDEYEDARVRVFHKENGGVSEARNVGLAHAKGAYIAFVDGDDFVSPYYLEVLFAGMEGRDNRIVSVGRCVVKAPTDGMEWSRSARWTLYSRSEAATRMMYCEVEEGPWSKLFPRKVFSDVAFPVGMYFEDLATFVGFLAKVDELAVSDEAVYAYVMSEDSIVRPQSFSSQKILDYQSALDRAVQDAASLGATGASILYRRALAFIRMQPLIDMAKGGARPRHLERENLCFVRAHALELLRDANVSLLSRIRIALFALSPRLHALFLNVFRRLS